MNRKFEELRNIAEEKLKENGPQRRDMTGTNIQKLVEELNVYQIELELQNRELKESNRLLRLSENKYKELYHHAPVSYFTLNSTGNILEMNQAACEMIGLQLEQCRYTSIFPYLEEHSKQIFVQFFKSLEITKRAAIDDIVFKNAYGQLVYGKIQANTYVDYESGEKRYRITISDITAQKEALEELEKTEKELRELIAMKDKLFSIISHDLKNPINTILNFSKLIERNFEKYNAQKIKRYNQFIQNSSESINKLLENLLIWSHRQREKQHMLIEILDVFNIADDTVRLFASAAGTKKIDLCNKILQGTTAIGDKEMTATIIRNLVANAIKFTERNGNVTIDANTRDDMLVVSIADTGIGMSKEKRDNVFKPDHSSSTVGTDGETGTGLGLLICKEFIEKQNGDIWVESQPGLGTTFFFSMPLA